MLQCADAHTPCAPAWHPWAEAVFALSECPALRQAVWGKGRKRWCAADTSISAGAGLGPVLHWAAGEAPGLCSCPCANSSCLHGRLCRDRGRHRPKANWEKLLARAGEGPVHAHPLANVYYGLSMQKTVSWLHRNKRDKRDASPKQL